MPDGLRERIGRLARVVSSRPDEVESPLWDDVINRLREADQRETTAFRRVQTLEDWERLLQPRIKALRASLGPFPSPVPPLEARVTRTTRGEGFVVENHVFQSRPRLFVSASLYRPADRRDSMPGVLVCHSHHHPKSEGELQDLGMNWARAGCVVLIMDLLGHGERRDHPFDTLDSHPRRFRANRQDYWFRYDLGLQLQLIGESLMGWMVWDVMRGIDLLLERRDVDSRRIVLLGAVAGGGGIAAVAAALDQRVAAVVPFGFGKASRLPGSSASETAGAPITFTGAGGWESTRNLRLSASRGFAPWVILGSIAPRCLVYAHEFGWDPDTDPVWVRLRQIFALHSATDHLAVIHGRGGVSGPPPENTHCTNVGPIHRRQIYPVLDRWLGVPQPEAERRSRLNSDDLMCMTAGAREELMPSSAVRSASALADERTAEARALRRDLSARQRAKRLRGEVERLLGDIKAARASSVVRQRRRRITIGVEETVLLRVGPGMELVVRLLLPSRVVSTRLPVVIGIAQGGTVRLYEARKTLIKKLVKRGISVCLVEPRGTATSRHDAEARGRRSFASRISASEWMLGQTLLGSRLGDLRSAVGYLRERPDLDASRFALWGDSLAPHNANERGVEVPHDSDPAPSIAEPLGGLLALLVSLYEPGARAVYLRGGLISFSSIMESPFCYVPHDCIVPEILAVADLGDIAAAAAPVPLRIEAPVDGRNRSVAADRLEKGFEPAVEAYRAVGATEQIELSNEPSSSTEVARWLVANLDRASTAVSRHPSARP